MPETIARRLARFVVETTPGSVPGAVTERTKALIFQGLISAVAGTKHPSTRRILDAVLELEPSPPRGVAILGNGTRLPAPAAAFCNSELIHRGARLDVFQLLTHPGTSILPAALVASQLEGSSGAELLTAVAVGYEVHNRMARDRIPQAQANGFRSSPVFGIFGAIAAAGRLRGLDEDELVTAIAVGVEQASGNLEGVRQGSDTFTIQEPSAARNAVWAVNLARAGLRGAESTLEGEAGFYYAVCGPRASVVPPIPGSGTVGFDDVTADLGTSWAALETSLRLYDANGYNVPILECTTALCVADDIDPSHVASVEVEVNWHEMAYPSPVFVSSTKRRTLAASPAYYAAYGIICRGYPIERPRPSGHSLADDEPPGLSDMMARVRVIPSTTRPVMTPIVTIRTHDRAMHRIEADGSELRLDLETAVQRLRPLLPALPITPAAYHELSDAIRDLENLPDVEALVGLTVA